MDGWMAEVAQSLRLRTFSLAVSECQSVFSGITLRTFFFFLTRAGPRSANALTVGLARFWTPGNFFFECPVHVQATRAHTCMQSPVM